MRGRPPGALRRHQRCRRGVRGAREASGEGVEARQRLRVSFTQFCPPRCSNIGAGVCITLQTWGAPVGAGPPPPLPVCAGAWGCDRGASVGAPGVRGWRRRRAAERSMPPYGAAPGGIARGGGGAGRGGDVRPGGGPDAPGGGRTLRPTYARHRLVSAMEWERGRCREWGATIPPATGSRGRPSIPAASARILGSALGSPPSKVGGPLGPVPCSPEVGDRGAAHWSRRRRPRAGVQRAPLPWPWRRRATAPRAASCPRA